MSDVDCNSVLEQLSEFLDADAREELCREIAAHMERCPDCRIKVDKVKKTIMLYQNGGPATELPVQVTAKLAAALAREYGGRGSSARGD